MGKRSREKRENKKERELVTTEKRFEFRSPLEKTCLFFIRWGTYLVMFTPLIINTGFFFPFVAPKTTFFRLIIEIIFVAYLFLIIANGRKYRPRINNLTISLILFLAVFILASFTGINFERSFWSTYERMTGIWTMLHLFAFFVISASCFRKKEDWDKLLGVSVIVGVFLSLYVLTSDQASSRGGGTIGNTSFMAAYLLFDVFFAIILFLSKRGVWQIFSGICLAILLPALLTSTARGAIFAFFLGLLLLVLGYMFFSKKRILKRIALGIVGLVFILAIFLAVFQSTPLIQNSINSTLHDMEARFVVWEKGWKGFLERPVLGWGPENFNVVFLRYFNPCMFLDECGSEIWFDRVHNIVLDTLVTTGVVGLMAYLAIFGFAIYELLNIASKIVEKKNLFIPLGLAALLIVYFIQNLLVFDMINSYLVFFLVLGFINFLIQKPHDFKEEKVKRINPILGLGIVVGAMLLFWWGNIQPLVANYYIIRTVKAQNIEEVPSLFQKSLSSLMNKYEAREYFSQRISRAAYQDISADARPSFQQVFDLAESEMKKSINQNFLDFRHYLFLGEIYVSSYRFNQNQEDIKKAEEVLAKAITLSPTNQQGYWQLAEAKVSQRKIAEAIPLLQKSVELEPRLGISHWYLAMAYKIVGQNQLAKEEIIEAEKRGFHWRENLDNLKKAIDVYLSLNDNESLVPLYLKAIGTEPENDQFWASLSAVYANLGEFDKARQSAQKVIEINPEMTAKVQKFLETLPQ